MTAKPARRTFSRLPRERRERDILDAARTEFCRNGYDGAAISDIAAIAGVVEGTIYKYFKNKRDLLVRVVEQWYRGMVEDYVVQLRGQTGVRNRLRFVIWRHLNTIHEEPDLCRLVFREIRSGEDYRATTVAEWNRRYTQVALDIVREGVEAGEFRADVPSRLVRDLIYGTIEHYTWAFLNGGAEFDPSDVADLLTDVAYRSIAAAPAADEVPAPAHAELGRLDRIADRLERTADRLAAANGNG